MTSSGIGGTGRRPHASRVAGGRCSRGHPRAAVGYRPAVFCRPGGVVISPQAIKLDEILRHAPKAVDMDLPHQREAGEHAEALASEPEGVTTIDAPDIGGYWV